jgi:hypothetical protein
MTRASYFVLGLLLVATSGVAGVISVESPASGSLVIDGQVSTTVATTLAPSGTTQTVNWANSNVQVIDLGSASGNVTLTFSNPASGAAYILKVIQGATARTLTFPAAVIWESGSAMVLTSTDDAVDIASCTYVGSNYLCNYGSDYK